MFITTPYLLWCVLLALVCGAIVLAFVGAWFLIESSDLMGALAIWVVALAVAALVMATHDRLASLGLLDVANPLPEKSLTCPTP